MRPSSRKASMAPAWRGAEPQVCTTVTRCARRPAATVAGMLQYVQIQSVHRLLAGKGRGARLIFTILMIMSNVPSVYPYLASPVPASCWRRGRARATPRSTGRRQAAGILATGPVRGRGQRARFGRPWTASSPWCARQRGAGGAATGGRLPGYRGGSGGRGHGDQPGDGGAAFAGPARTPRAVLVALADMPGFATPAWRACWMRCNMRRWRRVASGTARPSRGFRADLLPRLALLSADEGARRLLGQPGLRLVEVEDPGVLLDIDTPADLDRAG